ncbi:LysR substrate-binding domain-containing protein [Bosea sp. LjRoot237]|uniref:LysR substrate-binding domain-containing protein n=1 Tax=Bosea sp. LjRoot237 TaxID=3342292 RepID=UPI003ECE3FFD
MKRLQIPLNALRSFEAAARLGRMSAAAEELAVTHGAISRQVRHLEAILGVALFDGPRTRPRLTPTGKAFLPSLSAAFDQIETAVQTVLRAEDEVLDVGCLSTFLMRWLIPRLHRFRERHPNIDVRLSATDYSPGLKPKRFDVEIAVDEAPRPGGAGETARILFQEWLGPVARPDLASRGAGDLSPPLLLRTKTRMNAWPMWCAAAGIDAIEAAGTTFDHYYYTLEAAGAGLGICIAPWHLVLGDIEAGRLIAPQGFVRSDYCYVARTRSPSNPKIERFCAWLTDEAASMPAPASAHSTVSQSDVGP